MESDFWDIKSTNNMGPTIGISPFKSSITIWAQFTSLQKRKDYELLSMYKKSLIWPFLKKNDLNGTYFLLQLFVYKNLPLELLFLAIHIFDKTMGLKVLALCRNMLKKKGLFTLGQLFLYNIVLHVKPLKIAKYVHSKIMCNAHTYLQRDSFSRL